MLCCLAACHRAASVHLDFDVGADGHFTTIKNAKIPLQLVMTGKEDTLEHLPSNMRRNVEKTLALNPGMKTRYLSDSQCRMYVRQHCDDELAEFYNAEKAGHFRGDICRAAVLFHEGGFYADLDLEPVLPFNALVDNSTKFMSVFTHDGAILNALMAVVPESPVMKETLLEIHQWYKGAAHYQGSEGEWMGTMTLKRGLQSVMKNSCPAIDLETQRQTSELQWRCGPHDFRFYHEDKLKCGRRTLWHAGAGTPECPLVRKNSNFAGLKYGIFTAGDSRKLIAWPRTATCDSWWCGGR